METPTNTDDPNTCLKLITHKQSQPNLFSGQEYDIEPSVPESPYLLNKDDCFIRRERIVDVICKSPRNYEKNAPTDDVSVQIHKNKIEKKYDSSTKQTERRTKNDGPCTGNVKDIPLNPKMNIVNDEITKEVDKSPQKRKTKTKNNRNGKNKQNPAVRYVDNKYEKSSKNVPSLSPKYVKLATIKESEDENAILSPQAYKAAKKTTMETLTYTDVINPEEEEDEIFFGKLTLREIKKHIFMQRQVPCSSRVEMETPSNTDDPNTSLKLITHTQSQPNLFSGQEYDIEPSVPESPHLLNEDNSFITRERIVDVICKSPRNYEKNASTDNVSVQIHKNKIEKKSDASTKRTEVVDVICKSARNYEKTAPIHDVSVQIHKNKIEKKSDSSTKQTELVDVICKSPRNYENNALTHDASVQIHKNKIEKKSDATAKQTERRTKNEGPCTGNEKDIPLNPKMNIVNNEIVKEVDKSPQKGKRKIKNKQNANNKQNPKVRCSSRVEMETPTNTDDPNTCLKLITHTQSQPNLFPGQEYDIDPESPHLLNEDNSFITREIIVDVICKSPRNYEKNASTDNVSVQIHKNKIEKKSDASTKRTEAVDVICKSARNYEKNAPIHDVSVQIHNIKIEKNSDASTKQTELVDVICKSPRNYENNALSHDVSVQIHKNKREKKSDAKAKQTERRTKNDGPCTGNVKDIPLNPKMNIVNNEIVKEIDKSPQKGKRKTKNKQNANNKQNPKVRCSSRVEMETPTNTDDPNTCLKLITHTQSQPNLFPGQEYDIDPESPHLLNDDNSFITRERIVDVICKSPRNYEKNAPTDDVSVQIHKNKIEKKSDASTKRTEVVDVICKSARNYEKNVPIHDVSVQVHNIKIEKNSDASTKQTELVDVICKSPRNYENNALTHDVSVQTHKNKREKKSDATAKQTERRTKNDGPCTGNVKDIPLNPKMNIVNNEIIKEVDKSPQKGKRKTKNKQNANNKQNPKVRCSSRVEMETPTNTDDPNTCLKLITHTQSQPNLFPGQEYDIDPESPHLLNEDNSFITRERIVDVICKSPRNYEKNAPTDDVSVQIHKNKIEKKSDASTKRTEVVDVICKSARNYEKNVPIHDVSVQIHNIKIEKNSDASTKQTELVDVICKSPRNYKNNALTHDVSIQTHKNKREKKSDATAKQTERRTKNDGPCTGNVKDIPLNPKMNIVNNEIVKEVDKSPQKGKRKTKNKQNANNKQNPKVRCSSRVEMETPTNTDDPNTSLKLITDTQLQPNLFPGQEYDIDPESPHLLNEDNSFITRERIADVICKSPRTYEKNAPTDDVSVQIHKNKIEKKSDASTKRTEVVDVICKSARNYEKNVPIHDVSVQIQNIKIEKNSDASTKQTELVDVICKSPRNYENNALSHDVSVQIHKNEIEKKSDAMAKQTERRTKNDGPCTGNVKDIPLNPKMNIVNNEIVKEVDKSPQKRNTTVKNEQNPKVRYVDNKYEKSSNNVPYLIPKYVKLVTIKKSEDENAILSPQAYKAAKKTTMETLTYTEVINPEDEEDEIFFGKLTLREIKKHIFTQSQVPCSSRVEMERSQSLPNLFSGQEYDIEPSVPESPHLLNEDDSFIRREIVDVICKSPRNYEKNAPTDDVSVQIHKNKIEKKSDASTKQTELIDIICKSPRNHERYAPTHDVSVQIHKNKIEKESDASTKQTEFVDVICKSPRNYENNALTHDVSVQIHKNKTEKKSDASTKQTARRTKNDGPCTGNVKDRPLNPTMNIVNDEITKEVDKSPQKRKTKTKNEQNAKNDPNTSLKLITHTQSQPNLFSSQEYDIVPESPHLLNEDGSFIGRERIVDVICNSPRNYENNAPTDDVSVQIHKNKIEKKSDASTKRTEIVDVICKSARNYEKNAPTHDVSVQIHKKKIEKKSDASTKQTERRTKNDGPFTGNVKEIPVNPIKVNNEITKEVDKSHKKRKRTTKNKQNAKNKQNSKVMYADNKYEKSSNNAIKQLPQKHNEGYRSPIHTKINPVFKTPALTMSHRIISTSYVKKTPLKTNTYQQICRPVASYIKNGAIVPILKTCRPHKHLHVPSLIPKYVKLATIKKSEDENAILSPQAYKAAKKTRMETVTYTEVINPKDEEDEIFFGKLTPREIKKHTFTQRQIPCSSHVEIERPTNTDDPNTSLNLITHTQSQPNLFSGQEYDIVPESSHLLNEDDSFIRRERIVDVICKSLRNHENNVQSNNTFEFIEEIEKKSYKSPKPTERRTKNNDSSTENSKDIPVNLEMNIVVDEITNEMYKSPQKLNSGKNKQSPKVRCPNRVEMESPSNANNPKNSLKLIRTQSQPNLISGPEYDIWSPVPESPHLMLNEDDSFIRIERFVDEICMSPRNYENNEDFDNTLEFIDYVLNNALTDDVSVQIHKNKIEKKSDESPKQSERRTKNDNTFIGNVKEIPVNPEMNTVNDEIKEVYKSPQKLNNAKNKQNPKVRYFDNKHEKSPINAIKQSLQKHNEGYLSPVHTKINPVFKPPAQTLSHGVISTSYVKTNPLKTNTYQHISGPVASNIKNGAIVPILKTIQPYKHLRVPFLIPKHVKLATIMESEDEYAILSPQAFKAAKKTTMIDLPDENKLHKSSNSKIRSALPTAMKVKHICRENTVSKQPKANTDNISYHQAELSIGTQESLKVRNRKK